VYTVNMAIQRLSSGEEYLDPSFSGIFGAAGAQYDGDK
jgi:hypothetical protein